MSAIANTKRRGAIYWFRKGRRLPCGKLFRATVSLKTACPRTARYRAAMMTAMFEALCMRLLGDSPEKCTLDPDQAARIFELEMRKVLDQLEEEHQRSLSSDYDYKDIHQFLDVYEAVYRFLAEKDNASEDLDLEELESAFPHLDHIASMSCWDILRRPKNTHYQKLDDAYDALEALGIDTTFGHMDHGWRTLCEARVAAIITYRQHMADPLRKYGVGEVRRARQEIVALPPVASAYPALASSIAANEAGPPVPSDWATLTASEAADKFVADNPKLLGGGKREGRWTDKTLSQFKTAMRLLQKSMGPKPFWQLTHGDLQQLLVHFDGLPPNHHKSPRHESMTLAEICGEAQAEIKAGRLDKSKLGLNVPTLNRHFRFIRTVHDWMLKQVPQAQPIDWSAFTFDDKRSAREQRSAFPVELARKIFRLPPWHGCGGIRQRMRPGREIFHDAFYWVLPILWYSGMRREEACKLQVSDIRQDDAAIWFFDVDDTEAGRVKSNASRRKIPVAEELVRMNLLAFVDACRAEGRTLLFPELVSTQRQMGDTYYKHCWSHLLKAAGAASDGVTLHGIRHMVADELKASGVSEEIRADLLGHSLESETAGRYSKASRLAVLKDVVDQIPIVTRTVRPEAKIRLR